MLKLATLNDGTRDGKLLIVSQDLKKAVSAASVATTMQEAIDNWSNCLPKLQEIAKNLEDNNIQNIIDFTSLNCHSPLPRAYQWIDGSAYLHHVKLVRQARGAEMPDNFWHSPLMYQGGSDYFLGPKDDITIEDLSWGLDFESEVAVITDDVPMGVSVDAAAKHIILIMLVNDISLRNLIPAELAKSFGFFQSKPPSAFSPVAVTPVVLADFWRDSKLHLPLISTLNNEQIGSPNAGVDMHFDFAQLIAHAAKTRPLKAGSIIGSGTISNEDPNNGSSCLAEKRMIEIIKTGEAKTTFMQYDDIIKIEMLDDKQASIFGAIEQKVVPYNK